MNNPHKEEAVFSIRRNHQKFVRLAAVGMVGVAVSMGAALTGTVAPAFGSSTTSAATTAPARPLARIHLTAPRVVVGSTVVITTKGTKVPAGVRTVVVSFGDQTPKLRTAHVPRRIRHIFHRLGRHTITMRI